MGGLFHGERRVSETLTEITILDVLHITLVDCVAMDV